MAAGKFTIACGNPSCENQGRIHNPYRLCDDCAEDFKNAMDLNQQQIEESKTPKSYL